ncbi:MAG TPA: hypothetical protein DIW43_14415 [Spongiibacteraceae bacterium]|nr:hypothetical protein [Spongiibacteraceae bacterium]HCS28652.1 hypothetical protein [Spongiibacteraceae bacterium]
MNMHRLKSVALAVSLSMLALTGAQVHAASSDEEAGEAEVAPPKPKVPVSAVLSVGHKKNVAAKQSQVRIDKLAAETRDLLADYKTVMKQVDGLKIYNARLEKQITNQIRRIKELESSIAEATVIQRQMMPTIIKMIDGLEEFVRLDVPFHAEEREKRIEFLRNNLDRSDVSIAEKFRQVLEAYKIETEYGRKIDTYAGKAPVDGVERDVNFLRIGRIALLYQSTDTESNGMWDNNKREFVPLGSEYRGAILKGLRIARKQASIDIMKLPIPAPEDVQ